MRVGCRNVAAVAAVCAALLAVPTFVSAEDAPEWPSEQEQRLSDLEQQSLDVQRKLFAARMMQDAEDVRRLSKEMKAVKKERVQLMRVLGQLPPASK